MRARLLVVLCLTVAACGGSQPPDSNRANTLPASGNAPVTAGDNAAHEPPSNEAVETPKAVNWSTKPLKRYSAEVEGVKYSVELPEGYRLVEKRRGRGANEHQLHVYEYKVEHPWGPEVEVWVWKDFAPTSRDELDNRLPPAVTFPPGDAQPVAESWNEGKAFVDGSVFLNTYRGTVYSPGTTHTLVFGFVWRPMFPEEPGADVGKDLFKRVAKSLRLE